MILYNFATLKAKIQSQHTAKLSKIEPPGSGRKQEFETVRHRQSSDFSVGKM